MSIRVTKNGKLTLTSCREEYGNNSYQEYREPYVDVYTEVTKRNGYKLIKGFSMSMGE
jgi:hypothetical protein